jgi:hypothetical protein
MTLTRKQVGAGAEVLEAWMGDRRAYEDPTACVITIWHAINDEGPEHVAFMDRLEKRLDEQSHALALILEQLTPEGCGEERAHNDPRAIQKSD